MQKATFNLGFGGELLQMAILASFIVFSSVTVFAQESSGSASSGTVTSAVPVAPPSDIPVAPAVEPGFDGMPLDSQRPVTVKILTPAPSAIVNSNQVDVFFEIQNYVLAQGGNRLHVIIDNNPPVAHFSPRKPLTLKNLSEGGHMIRVIATQPDGLAIKQPEAYASAHFFVRKKDFQNFTNTDLPYLTVNLPLNETVDVPAGGRLWLDYITHNTGKKEDRNYSVRYRLNNVEGNARDGKAVYWENLPPGRYDMVVDLVDRSNTPAVGVFNQVKRSFVVRAVQKAIILNPDPSAPAVAPHD